ncbi:precorrin-3B C(17)-methyltransferase [Lusitaniella coriacea LEGE 07157]|uniref:Precorrin-3B C(17)-methyltransferase n=1 Tax=Lusitaniella coriacea LEGE 07157 TaxID=945747 RepID=A0A8J7IXF2_9CYAN|nr:precorrin-3B C(17)-methyltransferase [Lusitaniella coriacea]MBE9118712.1 precorrin-3B C(17)-methyltransferase [Lusitaniella coriacea LEGE 07157]
MTPFKEFQPLAAIATTPAAVKILQPLCQSCGGTLWGPEALSTVEGIQIYRQPLKQQLADLWGSHRALIFCMATGAVVRLIAPLLGDKTRDPAVIVLDRAGKFVISLSGAHQGGGDRLTQGIAAQLGATAILTGASASLDLPGIDVLGKPWGWQRGTGDWTAVSSAIARGETLNVFQEVGSTLWHQHLPPEQQEKFALQPITNPIDSNVSTLWISHRECPPVPNASIAQWHPRVLWLGIGCERGASAQFIDRAISETLGRDRLSDRAIVGIATLDLKADEPGLLQVCQDRNLPLKTFSPESLALIEVPNPSLIVRDAVGTPSVAEAAALLAAQSDTLLAPKRIFKAEGESAVTLAIAQAEREYTGRSGQLWLVGMGPGQLDQMTPAAQSAVNQADAVIGYTLYLDSLKPLYRPGQIIEASPITQEQQRAQRAIELAQWGLSVAVVSSGDCGIYGMAGLVLEELLAIGWDGKTPAVRVFPGISALQAAASLVGAPLMHDFCAISLSDLLTPWEVIKKRLNVAAAADFVTVLYNPRSRKRTQQIVTAQTIFLQHRDPNTPVAIVRSAYRPDENVTLTTLAEMLQHPIDMLTTVAIGNCSTRKYENWMVTPRGYSIQS